MFEITITREFAAGHAIRLYDGSLEPVHGHNWLTKVTIAAETLDEIEVVADFHDIEKALDTLIAQAHNRHLNEIEPFVSGVNPTAERVAWWIAEHMKNHVPPHAKLSSVSVGEAPGCTATYRPK